MLLSFCQWTKRAMVFAHCSRSILVSLTSTLVSLEAKPKVRKINQPFCFGRRSSIVPKLSIPILPHGYQRHNQGNQTGLPLGNIGNGPQEPCGSHRPSRCSQSKEGMEAKPKHKLGVEHENVSISFLRWTKSMCFSLSIASQSSRPDFPFSAKIQKVNHEKNHSA